MFQHKKKHKQIFWYSICVLVLGFCVWFGFHFDFPHCATVIFCRNFWGKFTGVLFFFYFWREYWDEWECKSCPSRCISCFYPEIIPLHGFFFPLNVSLFVIVASTSTLPLDQLICISLLPFILHCVWSAPECEILFVLVFFFCLITHNFIRINRIWFQICVCVFFTYLADIFIKINMKYNKFFMATYVCGGTYSVEVYRPARLKISQRSAREYLLIYKSTSTAQKFRQSLFVLVFWLNKFPAVLFPSRHFGLKLVSCID